MDRNARSVIWLDQYCVLLSKEVSRNDPSSRSQCHSDSALASPANQNLVYLLSMTMVKQCHSWPSLSITLPGYVTSKTRPDFVFREIVSYVTNIFEVSVKGCPTVQTLRTLRSIP